MLSPVTAQGEGDLKLSVTSTNGATFTGVGNRAGAAGGDTAIRVTVTLFNAKMGKVKVTNVEGVFTDAEGKELGRDSVGPIEIPSKGNEQAVLYLGNGGGLYQFKVNGTVTYEKNGKVHTMPFSLDQTQ